MQVGSKNKKQFIVAYCVLHNASSVFHITIFAESHTNVLIAYSQLRCLSEALYHTKVSPLLLKKRKKSE